MFPDTFDADEVRGQVRERLRPVRLYHWMQVLASRNSANECRKMQTNMGEWMAATYDKIANEHLGFVQSVNEFFDIGDTAESDQIKLEAAGETL